MGDRMSSLAVSFLEGLAPDKTIRVPKEHSIIQTEVPIQAKYVRTDVLKIISSLHYGNGTGIEELSLHITPKKSNSLLFMTWMINCEVHHDDVFLIHQDGKLINLAGYEGFSSVLGNVPYSGITSSPYDADQASTMINVFMQYAIPAITTLPRRYTPAVRSAGTVTTYAFALNRCLSTMASWNETAISTGVIMEIPQ